jgi:hypothetical protein
MKQACFFIPMFFALTGFSQTGGQAAYQFLDLDFNSRSLALGGDFIALKDNDLNLAIANPASITPVMNNSVALNHFVYPSGINYGMAALGKHIEKLGTFTGHLRYVAYGKFTRTDATGVEQGSFSASDYALGIGYAKPLNAYFSVGGNFNLIFSSYETYTSFGLTGDIATLFYDEKTHITATIVARNIGYQLKGYTSKNHEPMPAEVLAGISYKFHHAPFRLSLMGTDLMNWDLTYNDPALMPTIDQLTGDTIPVPTASFVQKLAYHTNFGLEIVPTENFFIRVGFNYQHRNALGVIDRMGVAGFSFGTGLRIKKFAFNYGIAFYSAAGITNTFGITTNLDEWKRRP